MNPEELIKKMETDKSLRLEYTENIEFFKTCVKLGRIDLAIQCDDFITDEFIKEHIEELIKIDKRPMSHTQVLKKSAVYRDILIGRKEYELLIDLKYSILKEIKDERVIEELNKLADKEIESKRLKTDYAKYRAMQLNLIDLIATSSLPFDPVFYDIYYEQLKPIIGNLKYSNYYLSVKCMLMGDFALAEKVNNLITLEEKDLTEVVNNHWEKVLAYTNQEIPIVFCTSERLFNHYLEQKRYDLVCQFAISLLTEEIVEKHKSEFLKVSNPTNGQGRFNESLLNIFLEEKKYEICSKFDVEYKKDVIDKHGRELFKTATEITISNNRNQNLFDLLIEIERYDLLLKFDTSLITPDIITKYGVEIAKTLKDIPYPLNSNPNMLIAVIKAKKYELIEQFYQEVFTEDILTNYGEDIFKNLKEIPYSLTSNPLALKCALKAKNFGLINDFLDSIFTDDILEIEEFKEYIKVTNQIPYTFLNNPKVLEIVIDQKRYDLVAIFYSKAFTENNIEKLIDNIPQNATGIHHELQTTLGLQSILKKERYDLVTQDNFERVKIDESIIQKYGLKLLTKTEFLNTYKYSNTLLHLALENNLGDLIPLFSFEAYDDTIIETYGEYLLPLLKEKLNDLKVSYLRHPLFGASPKVKLRSLLIMLLENDELENIQKFDNSLFDEEIIDKYYEKILSVKEDLPRTFLPDNVYLFNKAMSEKKYQYIEKFSEVLFTDEVIEEHGYEIIDYFSEIGDIPYSIQSNKLFLEKCYERRAKKIILNMWPSTYTDTIIDKYYDVILEIIKENNDEIAYVLQSTPLLKRFLKEKKYDYINKMNLINLKAEEVLENYDDIANFVNSNIHSIFAVRMASNSTFVEKYLEICPLEYIEYIDKGEFETKSSLDKYIPRLIEWIIKYNDNKIPLDLVRSEKIKKYCKENNHHKLYLGFVINSDIQSITELQSIVDEYAHILNMDPDRLRRKLEALYAQNDEICQTLLPLMLEDRMNSLSPKHYLTISLYPDLQHEITNLNDKELLLIERILTHTDESNLDITTVLSNILKNLKHYKKIIDYSADLSNDQLSNLIYVLQRSYNVFDITNIEDLKEENFNAKVLYKFSEFEKKIDSEEIDIYTLREMLLLKKYGLDSNEAIFINKRYCADKSILANSKLDDSLKDIILDINEILNCENIDELKFYYKTVDTVLADYRTLIYLEAYIRKEYAKLYSETLYKLNDDDLLDKKTYMIKNQEALEQIKNINYKGQKPKVYVLNDDFNLDIHALGAYSGYTRPDNFLDDWNRPKMASHGVCTSYIGNNQIANARAYHPILGFDSIEADELLLVANYDIGSSGANLSYDTSRRIPANFLPPSDNINNTRHTHNEIVIERMRYVNGEARKRQPSYIVYLLDDINNKYNFMTKEELIKEYESAEVEKEIIDDIKNSKDTYFIQTLLSTNKITQEEAHKIKCVFYYEEVVQASIDMGIPIVIVDRLHYAKREMKKCNLMYQRLVKTKDPDYISILLLTFFNNMIGCIDYEDNDLEYNRYFSEDSFNEIFNKLIDNIDSIEDSNIRMLQLNTLLNDLNIEKTKRDTYSGAAGFNTTKVDSYITLVQNKIAELTIGLTEEQNDKSTQPKK